MYIAVKLGGDVILQATSLRFWVLVLGLLQEE